jgi:YbbR domain-containing protein
MWLSGRVVLTGSGSPRTIELRAGIRESIASLVLTMIAGISSIFTDQLGLKLLALLLALVVYAHVYTEREQESTLRVPLRVTGLPPGLVLAEPTPEAVDLTARGKGKQVLKLKMETPEIIVDLSRVRPGRVQRMLSPTDVALPVGTEVTVTEIVAPRMVVFSVDTLVERSVGVEVLVEGEPGPGMALAGPLVAEPSQVTARGPLRSLDGLSTILAGPLRLSDVASGETVEIPLQADLSQVEVEPTSVTVVVTLAPLITRDLYPVSVRAVNLAFGLAARVEPDTAGVVFTGPATILDSLTSKSLEVRLDALTLPPGRHLLTPQIDLPDPLLTLVAVRPARFMVEIGSRPQ